LYHDDPSAIASAMHQTALPGRLVGPSLEALLLQSAEIVGTAALSAAAIRTPADAGGLMVWLGPALGS